MPRKSSRIQGVISNISSECKCINHAIYLSDGPNSSLDKCVLSIKRNKKYRRDVVDQMRTDGLLKEKEDLLCRHCYAVNMRKFFSSDDTGCDAEIEESEEPVAQVDEEDKEKTIEHHLTIIINLLRNGHPCIQGNDTLWMTLNKMCLLKLTLWNLSRKKISFCRNSFLGFQEYKEYRNTNIQWNQQNKIYFRNRNRNVLLPTRSHSCFAVLVSWELGPIVHFGVKDSNYVQRQSRTNWRIHYL